MGETQWGRHSERDIGGHSGRDGERDTVGEMVRETGWETYHAGVSFLVRVEGTHHVRALL